MRERRGKERSREYVMWLRLKSFLGNASSAATDDCCSLPDDTMDAFRVLTGGARFKKDDVRSVFEVSLFAVRVSLRRAIAEPCALVQTAPLPSTSKLPLELDFFGTTPAVDELSERAQLKKDKKRKRAQVAAESESAATDYAAFNRQHRIKFDGLDPPNPITSLDDLARHACPPVVLANWAKLALGAPTPIQMASWGCMLAVRPQSHWTRATC